MSFDWNASFEWFAEQFRLETGLMAPGKDDAMPSDMNERRKAWNEWMGVRSEQAWQEWHKRHGMLAASAVPADGREAMDNRKGGELYEAAREFFNLTHGDSSVIIRPPSAEKRDAIVAAGARLRAALATAPSATPAEYETATETLRHVIHCLRSTGTYTDKEGEATDYLEPLLWIATVRTKDEDARRMRTLCRLLDAMDDLGNGFPGDVHAAFQDGAKTTRAALAMGANGCGEFVTVYYGDIDAAEKTAREKLSAMQRDSYRFNWVLVMRADEEAYHGQAMTVERIDRANAEGEKS